MVPQGGRAARRRSSPRRRQLAATRDLIERHTQRLLGAHAPSLGEHAGDSVRPLAASTWDSKVARVRPRRSSVRVQPGSAPLERRIRGFSPTLTGRPATAMAGPRSGRPCWRAVRCRQAREHACASPSRTLRFGDLHDLYLAALGHTERRELAGAIPIYCGRRAPRPRRPVESGGVAL